MLLAAYMVAGFGVASVYAVGFLRGRRDRYHRLGFAIPFVLAAALTPVQFFVGDTAAREVAADQPVKFAAMEYVAHTTRGVPEYLGGVYADGHVSSGLRIPDLDSLLVGFSPHTKVTGWNSVAPADRPPVPTLIHLAFDAHGRRSVPASLIPALWRSWRGGGGARCPSSRSFWLLAAGAGPAALVAMECWLDRHRGRAPALGRLQLLTTAQAATTNHGVIESLTAVIVLYAVLGIATVLILRLLSRRWRQDDEPSRAVPYGPPRTPVGAEAR